MKKPRDTQRKRVYASDHALVRIAKPLPTVGDVERFVKRLFGMKRVRDAYRGVRFGVLPEVKDGRGRSRAGGCSAYITIPLWARNEAVVLHELAHTVCQREYGNATGHGWEFCAIYLTLTLHGMDRHAHDTLKAAFRENRVKFTAPRKRKPMDPERKAVLVARLAAYRAAQAAGAISEGAR